MRRFYLQRDGSDGPVAEGILFSNGRVCISWLSEHSSIGVYDNITSLMHRHGHTEGTRICFKDSISEPPPAPPTKMFPKPNEAFFLDQIGAKIDSAKTDEERAEALHLAKEGLTHGLYDETAFQELIARLFV